ncbi:MAG: phosphomannomutase/phosphoglucomutase [archaeon]
MNKNIFRAYDVRGIYGKDLTEEIANLIGKAFGTFVGNGKTIALGRDVRNSSDILSIGLMGGVISSGCNIIDFGLVTTPMLSILIKNKKLDGGIMVTASHNPSEWNGFIMINSSGHFCSEGMGMEKIKEIVFSEQFFNSEKKGNIIKIDAFRDYENFLLGKINSSRNLRVVLDPGNGSASKIAKNLFEKAGHDVISINDYPHGDFPARAPDVRENDLQLLKEKVLEADADIGIGFDCDADRVAFIDEMGNYLGSGNITIGIFSKHYLKNNPGGKIVFDVTCSSAVEDFIKENNGIPLVNRVGHAFIVNRMIEENAIFGGEYSNHLYFSDIHGFDDAIYAALKMVEIMSSENKKLSELASQIPKYHSTDILEIPCDDEHKFSVIEKIKQRLENENYNVFSLDGVKVMKGEGSFLIRASNTMPVIKLNSESKNKEKLQELFEFAKKLIGEEIAGLSVP